MITWFTSDQHFFHKNIIEYSKRPFVDVDDMNHQLVERFNSRVGFADTTYHLGDLSFREGAVAEILQALNGNHILVAGNHDKCHTCHSKWKKSARDYISYGFKEVYSSITHLPENTSIGLSHLPYADDTVEDQRYSQFRPEKNLFKILLHGHVHEKYSRKGDQINVGVDVRNYYPSTLDELLRT